MKQRGRPRSFDRETALEQAIRTFWEHGYEATSVTDLTRAMGIGAPSMYAAFGDKQSLFEEVVRVYGQTYGGFGERAFAEEPTVRGGVARMLHEAAAKYTEAGHPAAASSSTPRRTARRRRSRRACVTSATPMSAPSRRG